MNKNMYKMVLLAFLKIEYKCDRIDKALCKNMIAYRCIGAYKNRGREK